MSVTGQKQSLNKQVHKLWKIHIMSLDMNLEIEGDSPDWAALEKAAKAAVVGELTNSFSRPPPKKVFCLIFIKRKSNLMVGF